MKANFKTPAVLQTKEGQWVVLGLVALVVVYYIGKKLVTAGTAAAGAAANAVGGVVTGNNAVTQGTEYQGTGVAGTLGAAVDSAGGGVFSAIGDWIGAQLPGSGNDYDPNAPTASAVSRAQVVTPNYVTDVSQTTPIGGVSGDDWD